MIRRCLAGLTLVLFVSAGCLWDDRKPGANRYGAERNVPVPTPDKLPPGSTEAATWVDSLGRKILAANSGLGVQPVFRTIHVPALTLFHIGTAQICISDGVVAKCKNDGELAAVLCAELGAMVAEAKAQAPVVNPDERPFTPPIGSDVVGGGGDPDRTRLAEQGMWDKKNPRPRGGAPLPVQNPGLLARQYLLQAGYNSEELLRVSNLLHQAAANPHYEKLLNGSSGGPGILNGN